MSLRVGPSLAVLFSCLFALTPADAARLDLATATIADLQAAFAAGTLTSEELVSAYLARIEAYDQQGPTINTVITLNEKALAEAKQADAERKAGKIRGPLHGIPVVLKDNYDTFDMPTTAGSSLLKGSIPPDDAFVVKRLRDAGAIILAKVNLERVRRGRRQRRRCNRSGDHQSRNGAERLQLDGRPDAQSARARVRSVRLERRHGRRDRGGVRAVRVRHRHGELRARPFVRQRHRGLEADHRA